MSDRLFTLIGAGLALILLAWLFGAAPDPAGPAASRPTSQDSGTAGLLGLYRWLGSSGVPVRRLRQRYSGLPAAETGSLLLIAEPMVWSVRPVEGAALREWVERGNHVLLMSSVAQTVAWGWRASNSELGDAMGLQRSWLNLNPAPEGEEDKAPDADLARRQAFCSGAAITRGTITGPQRRLRPALAQGHPALTGVREVLLKSPPPTGAFYRPLEYAQQPRHWYPLLCDPQLRLPVFSVFRFGEGRVWALDYSEAFGNDNLDRGDNARLFSNLVAFALGPDGAVIFDDMHQGDSELYDPAAFFGDPRLHGTLAFLLGMWLVWLLGYSNRFAPPVAPAARVTGRDFMLAVGRFYARYLRPDEAAHGLFRNFFNEVRQRYRLAPTGEPAWEALDRGLGRADAELSQLRALHERLARGGKVDLTRLRNLILKVQHSLT